MNSGALNRGREFCQYRGRQRQTLLKHQRLARLLGRQKGERDFRKTTFLRPEAGPEAGVNDRFNGAGIRSMCKFLLTSPARFDQMPGKMSFDSSSHGPGRLIGWFASHNDSPQITQVWK